MVAAGGSGSVIRGLVLTRFNRAIVLQGDHNVVAGNYLGVPSSGTANGFGNETGVAVLGGNSNRIGGQSAADRNVIGANYNGIVVQGTDPSGTPVSGNAESNDVIGNYVGLRANGSTAAANTYGINISNSRFTFIGDSAAPNIISGNTFGLHDQSSLGLALWSNRIGTNAGGTAAVANQIGAELYYTQGPSVVGNTISGNTDSGLHVAGSVDLYLTGNTIGLNTAGTSRVPNRYGLYVQGESGAAVRADHNTVAGNDLGGAYLYDVNVSLINNVFGSPTTATSLGNRAVGLHLGSASGTVYGNVISGNGADYYSPGLRIDDSHDVTVKANRIGTDTTGATAVGNVGAGISLCDSNDVEVGGPHAADPNIISGNDAGIQVSCSTSTENTIRNNVIGRAADRSTPLPNTTDGVLIENSDRNDLVDNLIADNGGAGVAIDHQSDSNRLSGNSVTGNGGLGIDLGQDGVTANDTLDRDSGANALQNVPVLDRAGSDGSVTLVRGTLATRAARDYRIEFYASETCDASGHGEGARPLGSTTVTTNGSGDASFEANLSTVVAAGQQITATATDLRREDTSEFSACRTVVSFPRASIDDVTTTEPASGTRDATFTVSLSSPATVAGSVRATTVAGTASAGSDFTAVDTVVSFAPGETSRTVTVPIIGDGVEEPTEYYTVRLSEPDGLTLGDDTGAGTILDNSPPVTVSVDDASVTEPTNGTSNASVVVRLSRPTLRDVTVSYSTAAGTAGSADFTAKTGTVTVPAGSTTATVLVPVKADAIDEPDEAFSVNLSAPNGATITDAQSTVTIVDSNPTPTLSTGDVTAAEGAAGASKTFTFTVTLSGRSSSPVTVAYATANGTAIAPGDYAAKTGVLTFAVGALSKTVTVTVKGDAVVEPDEDFTLNLSNPTSATLGDGTGLGTITNDD